MINEHDIVVLTEALPEEGLWSFSEYLREVSEIVAQKYPLVTITANGEDLVRRSFVIQVDNIGKTIGDEIETLGRMFREIHPVAERNLSERVQPGSIVMSFDFPPGVKVACEQYLLYFAQFLRDLGVEAETAITHEAGQALFTVTPNEKSHALDNIRTALDVYLRLPSNPIGDSSGESIAVQRLEANVLRLRSDLKLASAELQAHAKTIEAQQLIIDVQKGLLSGEVIIDSIKNVTPKPETPDKEGFLGGTVSLIPIKGKGVEIHLPEIFRRLKRLIGSSDL